MNVKTLFSTLSSALISSSVLFAGQTAEMPKLGKIGVAPANQSIAVPELSQDIVFSSGKYGIKSAATWSQLGQRINIQLNHLGSTSPLAYDPYSNLLAFGVVTLFGAPPNNTGRLAVYNTFRSANNGNTWSIDTSGRTAFEVEGYILRSPSLNFINPTKSTDTSKVGFFIWTNGFSWNAGTQNATFIGGYMFDRLRTDIFDQVVTGPEKLNPGNKYRWGLVQTASFGNKVFGVSTLNPIDNNTQYGAYGTFGYDFDGNYISTIPASLALSRFGYPTGGSAPPTTSSYNGSPTVAVDPEGNGYVGVINFNGTGAVADGRRTAVTRSTDGGETWSASDVMPLSVQEAYSLAEARKLTGNNALQAADIRFTPLPGSQAYQQHTFVATGNNQFSFFYRAFLSAGNQGFFLIVEAFKKNDQWGMRTAAELNDVPSILEVSDNNELADTLREHSLGNEIQAARTADGSAIVLKYIDVSKYLKFASPVNMADTTNAGTGATGRFRLDSINTTDLFLTYRNSDATTWSTPINATQDDMFDKYTFIPPVIKDINTIPATRYVSAIATGTSQTHRLSYPQGALQAAVDLGFSYNLFFAMLDATKATSVSEQTMPQGTELYEAYPNPSANGVVEMTYNIPAGVNATLEVRTMLGEKVWSRAIVGQGSVAGMSVELNNVPSGMYLYSLRVGSASITKTLSIIK